MTGLGTAQQKKTEKSGAAGNQAATTEQKAAPQNKTEHIRDLKRAERFEKLLSLAPENGYGNDKPPGTQAFFSIRGKGSYSITRTSEGYRFFASRVIDKEHHINFSEYYFDRNGKFIEKIKTFSTGEVLAPIKSGVVCLEVDRLIPQLGAHNEARHR